MKEMTISAINNGTVIDHIPPEQAFKIVEILGLDQDIKDVVSVATNLPSKKMGRKAMVKIDERYLTPEEVSKIAIIAPNATLCIIRDYKVESKSRLILPKKIDWIIKCNNPNCITNHQNVDTLFEVVKTEPLKIRCNYCERCIDGREIIVK